MSGSLDIRPYKKGDETQILELFSLSFGGRQMTLPYWKWRFQDNPAGPGVIELCWDGDLLVAHYAVTNLAMSIYGNIYSAGLSGTTMTHPRYRGRGLFPKLARPTYQRMSTDDMIMVWGFPNALSHPGFNADLSWQDIYEVPMFRLNTESIKIRSTLLTNKVCELTVADERFDRFWGKVKNDYDIIVRRDYSFINWRYFLNPIEKYRLVAYLDNEEIQGYAVFKHYENELQVVDLLVEKTNIEVAENLLRFMIAAGLSVNMQSISLWLNVSHPLHHALEKMGFRPEGPVTYLGGRALKSEFDRSFYDFRRWYFTMSDSDVF